MSATARSAPVRFSAHDRAEEPLPAAGGRGEPHHLPVQHAIALHTFCKVCGIKRFYIPRSNPDGIDVNVHCLDTPQASVTVTKFDGQNWEANAHKSRESS